jgi:hypothetical protein
VFSRLLAGDEEKGFCEVGLADLVEVKTQYLRNTAVVETILVDARGGQARVVDFAPRFDLFGRTYRAPQIVRRIEPVAGLLAPEDPRFRSTCETIGRELMRYGRIMRYAVPDDFGAPETAFLACSFWCIDALAQIGRRDEAREMFESVLARRNHFGLLSEDIHPETGELWGNFPQAYSMAGIINTATRLSSSWEEAWLRA